MCVWFCSTLGSHRIVQTAALLLTLWVLTEYSLKLFLSIFNHLNVHQHFNDAKLWLWRSSTVAVSAAIFKIFLFVWKWILIGLRGFIDRFWQTKFPPKSRYGVQIRLRAPLEPANIKNVAPTSVILHPYLSITTTSRRQPVIFFSVPKVAVVERFDCHGNVFDVLHRFLTSVWL